MPVQSPIEINSGAIKYADNVEPLEYHGHVMMKDNTDDKINNNDNNNNDNSNITNTNRIAKIQNTGQTVSIKFQLERNEQPYIIGGILKRNKYIFEELHFHWCNGNINDTIIISENYSGRYLHNGNGSEHKIDGIKYTMEAHLVHYNSKYRNFHEAKNKFDGLCVVGILIQCNENRMAKDCIEFKKISNAVKMIQKPYDSVLIDSDCLSWINLIDLNKHYYTYRGSLTTPPYYESVVWIIYRSPIYITKRQLLPFWNVRSNDENQLINKNCRDIQKYSNIPKIVFIRSINRKLRNSKSKL